MDGEIWEGFLVFLVKYKDELASGAALIGIVAFLFKPIRNLWRRTRAPDNPSDPSTSTSAKTTDGAAAAGTGNQVSQQNTKVSADGGQAIGGNFTKTENHGLAPEKLLGMVEQLQAEVRDQAREFGLKEGMLRALAQEYAEHDPEDFDAALRGIRRALVVAHEQAVRGALSSNLPDAVEAVLRQVDALNEAGDLGKGLQTLERELQARADEVERRQAEQVRLAETGIAQAVLARDAEAACRFELARLDLEHTGDATERFKALRRVRREWYERGRDKGLNFDLEVAIALARACLGRASSSNERGTAGNDLGNAFWKLGERESGTARLEAAVDAYRSALQEWTRERVPLDWAMTQNNLGTAL